MIKFYFYEKYVYSYFIAFINKKQEMFLFANNQDFSAVLTNELVSNIVYVNTKFIHIFEIKKKRYRYIKNIIVGSINGYKNLNYINLT